PAGTYPNSVTVADVAGDGQPDIVVTNYLAGTVSVLQGVGDGTFLAPAPYAVGVRPTSVMAADLVDQNGKATPDSRLDLVVANSGDGTVSVLPADGEGTFA